MNRSMLNNNQKTENSKKFNVKGKKVYVKGRGI